MIYEQSVQYLLNLPRLNRGEDLSYFKNKIENNLDFSFSQPTPHFFHVTGTNGKGSMVAYLQSLLVGQGYKVGTYQSPHVYDIRERILINGDMLSKDYFTDLVIESKGKYDCWSEYLIGMALSCFLKEKCEVVVWEVGIGGRFDLTNIVEHSTCCLTSVGLDHTRLLGANLSDIAWQKIGILKKSSSLVVGRVPHEVVPVIQNDIENFNTCTWWLDKEILIEENKIHYPTRTYENLISQEGPYQKENMALALGTLEIGGWIKDPYNVQSSLKKASLKGRWEKRMINEVEWIFDGAHNKEAALGVIDYIKTLDKKWILLGSCSVEHDPQYFFDHFSSIAYKFIWVDLSERSWKGKVPGYFIKKFKDMAQAIHYVEQEAKTEGYTVLVIGSFYLVGEVSKYFSFNK